MPRIAPAEGANVHCILDDFLWPWVDSTPVLMMHGFCPQRDILEPLGAGNRRNPPGLPPRPARLRPLGSTSERISLHSRDDRDVGPGGARRLVLVEGALGCESSGGIIGLLLAAAHPDCIASLVLYNTPTRVPEHIKAATRWVTP